MKRHLMTRKTSGFSEVTFPGASSISAEHAEILGTLMVEAYRGSIDYDGETVDQSIEEVRETLLGKYGRFIPEASFVVMSEKRAISAIVFVDFKKENMPLLAFTMTHPDFKGKGLSKKLIGLSLNQLEKMNFQECCLVVTEGNQPAQGIYEKLGFTYRS
jgi:ribosomal protein S18 acetylase RimI-like enzyme